MSLIAQLEQARASKLEQVGQLKAGAMRVFLLEIEVSGATLSEIREELQMLEALLAHLRSKSGL